MTPKEKAQEIVKKYYNFVSGWTATNKPNENHSAQYEGEIMRVGRAKQCAIIAVDEVLDNYSTSCSDCQDQQDEKFKFFIEVKQEIEKL